MKTIKNFETFTNEKFLDHLPKVFGGEEKEFIDPFQEKLEILEGDLSEFGNEISVFGDKNSVVVEIDNAKITINLNSGKIDIKGVGIDIDKINSAVEYIKGFFKI